jgi:hypothetical protein
MDESQDVKKKRERERKLECRVPFLFVGESKKLWGRNSQGKYKEADK